MTQPEPNIARLTEKLARLQEDKGLLLKKLEDTRRQLSLQDSIDQVAEEIETLASEVRAYNRSPVMLGAGNLTDILDILLPCLNFRRDSVAFLGQAVDEPDSLYRLLKALDKTLVEMPPGAGQVAGAPGWWEMSYRLERRENGRLYFRAGGEKNDVLISSKEGQTQDLMFLRGI